MNSLASSSLDFSATANSVSLSGSWHASGPTVASATSGSNRTASGSDNSPTPNPTVVNINAANVTAPDTNTRANARANAYSTPLASIWGNVATYPIAANPSQYNYWNFAYGLSNPQLPFPPAPAYAYAAPATPQPAATPVPLANRPTQVSAPPTANTSTRQRTPCALCPCPPATPHPRQTPASPHRSQTASQLRRARLTPPRPLRQSTAPASFAHISCGTYDSDEIAAAVYRSEARLCLQRALEWSATAAGLPWNAIRSSHVARIERERRRADGLLDAAVWADGEAARKKAVWDCGAVPRELRWREEAAEARLREREYANMAAGIGFWDKNPKREWMEAAGAAAKCAETYGRMAEVAAADPGCVVVEGKAIRTGGFDFYMEGCKAGYSELAERNAVREARRYWGHACPDFFSHSLY